MAIKILQYTFDSVINPNGVKPTIQPSSVQLTYEDSTVGKITTRIVYANTMPTRISFGNQPVLTLDYINVTEVQSLYGLFWGNSTIKSANISNQTAKNLIDIYGLFYGCNNIEKIDMSNLIIEKPITNSSSTFHNCGNLYELNLKGSKIDMDMYYTFQGCSSLIEIDTSVFITDRATTFRMCFGNCNRLKSIDISTWDTSAATEMWAMFEGSKQLENIVFGTNFKTSLVTNMDNMFSGCNNLKSINTLCFDTSSLQRCGNMFQNCTSLKILNLSSFNTSNVTTNGNMFNGLTSDLTIYRNSNTWTLTDTGGSPTFIDVNGKILGKYTFDNTGADCLPTLTGGTISSEDSVSDNVTTRTIYLTSDILPTKISFKQKDVKEIIYLNISSYITDCTDMFFECYSLININTDNWDTTNVLNMKGMFAYCTSLQSLDLSSFNTSNVTNMQNMFIRNDTLTSLNLSSFDTSNVIDMGSMFQNCSKLTSLDLSNFNTSKITSMYAMFQNCSKLTSLNLSNFNTGKVTNMTNMFNGCSSLTSLNLSSFDTSQILYINNIFNGCSSLTSLNLSNFNTSKVTNMSSMFQNCSKLTSLDLSNFNTSKVTNMIGMFSGCSKLTSLDLSNFNTSKVTDIGNMFNSCATLTSLDLSNFDTSQVTSMYAMFSGCSKLTSLDLSNFNVTNASLSFAFQNCNLRQIGLLYSDASSINKIAENLYATSNCDIYYYDVDPTQLTPADGVTFIKYEFPTTISLPPHISLYGLSDGTRDELDVKTGILTRKIGTQILDGSEAWRSSGSVFYTQILSGKINPYKKIIIDSSLKINLNTNGNLELDAATTSFTDVQELKNYLNDNNAKIIYQLSTPTTEKLILNYNHSCEYGMVLPKGAVDYYDVVNSKYHKNIGSVYLQGDETWQSAEEYDKCVRFGIEFRGTGESNIKPGGGLYCDNDLFPNIDDDSDVEHCRYASDDSNILYFYVDKTRLMSPDLIGWQIWQQENPYTMYFELADTVTLDKPYEELDPNLARWEMMDSVKEGIISYTSNNNDGLTLYPNMTYVAPSVNNFDVEVLEPNTEYTVYADNTGGSLNLGGNTSNFTSGSTFTSGEDKWVTFNSSPDVENIMLIKGDTTDEVVPYFTGINSVVNPTIKTPNKNLALVKKEAYSIDEVEITNIDGKINMSGSTTTSYATWDLTTGEKISSVKNYYVDKELCGQGTYTYKLVLDDIEEATYPTGNICSIHIQYDNDKSVEMQISEYGGKFRQYIYTGKIESSSKINGIYFKRWYAGTCDYISFTLQIEEGEVATDFVMAGGSTITPKITLRSSESGVKDSYNVLTGEYIRRVSEDLQELPNPIITTLEPKTLLAYENGKILLSSESGLIPTLTYATPSTNTFHLPSMKTGTRYTLKYPSASGNITIGNIKYNINSPSMLFTTPLTIVGDTSAIIFSDENPQDVMLIEGAYNTREIPLFTGVKSVVNPTINIIDNGTEESRTYRCQEEVELRSLPNGVADKLDIVGGKLTRAVGIRPYQDGDEDLPNALTDGYNTIYQLSKPTVSSVTFVTPVVTSDSTMHLSSEALIPQLNYRVPSNNNFPLDLLEPNKTYTLYANTLVSGSYTLGGTHNGYFTGTEVIALGDATNNLLTFDGDLGLSDVVLIKGNSMNSELPYFEGLKTVENATITIAGMQEEENSITLDDSITLRACGDIKDTIDMVNLVMTQRLSEITLKGTEPWSLITTNESINDEYVLFGLVIGGIKSSVTTSLVCDKFNHKYQSGEMHNQEGIYAVNNQLRICVKKTTIGGETVDAIKTWLGQNNTRVIYALINPIEYQLQNSWTSTPPTSYNNRTTISSQVVDSLKPMITVTIATTTLEQIVSNLETQNAQLEEENIATMLALTSVYELMSTPSVATTETQVATYGLRRSAEPIGMSVSPMGMVYARLVSKGFKTIEEVPYNLQPEVMYALRGME